LTISKFEPERFRSPAYLAVIDEKAASEQLCITQSCIDLIHREAESGYPLEVCGLLIGSLVSEGWQISDVRPVANLNTDRAADRFQLDPSAYQSIDRALRGTGSEIVGVYHSHPDCPAKPSPTDLGSAWEGFAYPIISVCDGQVAEMRCWMVNRSEDGFQHVHVVRSAP